MQQFARNLRRQICGKVQIELHFSKYYIQPYLKIQQRDIFVLTEENKLGEKRLNKYCFVYFHDI